MSVRLRAEKSTPLARVETKAISEMRETAFGSGSVVQTDLTERVREKLIARPFSPLLPSCLLIKAAFPASFALAN